MISICRLVPGKLCKSSPLLLVLLVLLGQHAIAEKFKAEGTEQYKECKSAAIEAFKQNQLVDSERLFRDALKILGPDLKYFDLRVETLMDLSLVYERQGNNSASRAAIEEAIELISKIYGSQSGRLPPLLDKLSDLTTERNKRVALLQKSVQIRESLLGNDASLIMVLGKLSAAQEGAEKTATTRRYYELRKRLPGFAMNSNSGQTALTLARDYLHSKQYDKAIEFATEGMSISQVKYGKNNVIEIANHVVLLLAKKESRKTNGTESDEMDQCLNEAIRISPEAEQLATCLISTCSLLSECDDNKNAAKVADILLNISHKATDISDQQIIFAQILASQVYWKNGQTDKAIAAINAYKEETIKRVPDKQERDKQLNDSRLQLQTLKMETLAACLK